MITSIIMIVLVVFLLVVLGIGFIIYSLIFKKHTMNEETKTKALDVFLYLGIVISLVWTVVNFMQIIFSAIDRKFVDIINAEAYVDAYSSDVRLAIASLIVMYPLYIALSWYVAKDITKFPYKRDLPIRKVMIYITLFITISSLIGTLVSVIYTYLGGELSVRFELKALLVFVVAGSLFGYYLYSMRRDYSQKSNIPMIATIATTIVIVASLIWSIGIIGTPAEMRAKKIDSTRLSNLSSIQQEIYNRFQTTETLPKSIDELTNAIQGYSVPLDPITSKPYVYKMIQQPVIRMNAATGRKELTTPAIFEICGTFDIVRDSNGPVMAKVPELSGDLQYSVSNYYYEGDRSPFWNHGVGYMCFKRVVTSNMYYPR